MPRVFPDIGGNGDEEEIEEVVRSRLHKENQGSR